MRITALTDEVRGTLRFLNASPRGRGPEITEAPVLIGTVDRLPPGIEALVATSDLQGVTTGMPRLAGEEVPDLLRGLGVLDPSRSGAILAGDFSSDSDARKRGATGDVLTVWRAFSESFRWTLGVAGNHDLFGAEAPSPGPLRHGNGEVLDGTLAVRDELSVAGVGGIIGKPSKVNRKTCDEYWVRISEVLDSGPEILVTHESPLVEGLGEKGSFELAEMVKGKTDLLHICGHCHWSMPLAQMPGGPQILNVDKRVVVLTTG